MVLFKPAVEAWTQPSGPEIPVGTDFLRGTDLSGDVGYVFVEGGKPAWLTANGSSRLVLGESFSGMCSGIIGDGVLLGEGKICAAEDLSGTACVVPGGMAFPNHGCGGSNDSPPDTFRSRALLPLCGFEKGFTASFPFAKLLPK